MKVQYQYTPQERRLASQAVLKGFPGPSSLSVGTFKLDPRLFLVALGIICIGVLIYLSHRTSTPAPRPRPILRPGSEDFLQQFLLPLIPWLLIIGFAWFFVIRSLRVRRTFWHDDPHACHVQTLTADEHGLIFEEPFVRTELEWEAFWGFEETDKVFILFTSDPKSAFKEYRFVPRSAFATPAEADAFRLLLRTHIDRRESAFPITFPEP